MPLVMFLAALVYFYLREGFCFMIDFVPTFRLPLV
jgi:hypothetical protein